MEILRRSNSSVSSRTGCPPDIVNEEDHTVEDLTVIYIYIYIYIYIDTHNGGARI